jgi:hypothetical protein
MRKPATNSIGKWRRAGRGVCFVALGVVGGCRQFLGADTFTVQKAGQDGGKPASGSTGCDAPRYPSRPNVGTSDTSGPDIVVSTYTLTWGDIQSPNVLPVDQLGFNLDGVCTTASASSSCVVPPYARWPIDGVSGIDNSSGRLLTTLAPNTLPLTKGDDLEERAGVRTYILRVRGYSGEPDDANVELAFFSAAGTVADGGIAPNDGGPGTQWFVGSKWGSPEHPTYVDNNAYVTDGKLVATFDALLLGEPKPAKITGYATVNGVKLVADIAQKNGAFTITHIVLGGRWPMEAILEQTSVFYFKNRSRRCSPPGASEKGYVDALRNACSYADVNALGGGPATSCDGLSFGAEFSAVPAAIIGVVETPEDLPCPPSFGVQLCEQLYEDESRDASAFDGAPSGP